MLARVTRRGSDRRDQLQLALRDPDIRLMLRVRDDEPAAFEELVELYQHRLVAVMHHLVGNAEEAEDLAQEVFLRVYRARKKYQPAAEVLDLAVHHRQQPGPELPAAPGSASRSCR